MRPLPHLPAAFHTLLALGMGALVLAACAAPATPAPATRSDAPAAAPSAATVAAPPAAPVLPPRPLELRIALGNSTVPLIPNSVIWLAKDLGYYEREGLDVELVELNGTPLAIAALVSGQADVGNLDTAAVLDMVGHGKADLRAINSSDTRQYFLLAGSTDLRAPTDVRGKAFGVARVGSADYTQSALVLRSLGLDPDADVQWLGIGDPATRARALVAGSVQATTVSIATWQLIRREPGVHVLVEPEPFFRAAPIVAKVNAATTEAIQAKPEELTRFTRALVAASRQFAQSRDAWADALAARRSDIDRAQLAELWDYFGQGWAVNGLLNVSQYAETARFLYGSGALPNVPEVPVERWTTTAVVDQVLAEMGVQPGTDDPGRTIAGAASR
jgi:NitT/TauT family transport system substrate-binding protein